MRLMEVMTTDVQTISPDASAEEAYQRMHTQRIHHLVVQDGGRVVGVVSERDLGGARGAVLRRGHSVGERMTPSAVTASPTTTVRQAANLLRARAIGCLPVLEGQRVVGIVTVADLLELLGRGAQLSPTASSRFKPAHGSKWKPVRATQRTPGPYVH